MFDISFFELLVCGVVALVIIGPERLPETVRTISLWIGRLKRSLRETRGELEKQLGADDIRRQLHNEEIMESLEKTRREIESAVKEGENSIASPASKSRQPADKTSSAPYVEHVELPDHAHTPDGETPAVNTQPENTPDHSTSPKSSH